MKLRFFSVLAALLAAAGPSCNQPLRLPALSHADSLAVIDDNLAFRAEQDSFFRSDPHSPFVRDTSASYHGIKWFPIDPQYCVQSVLHLYADADTVDVMGTRGERRRQLRYGYFEFPLPSRGGVSLLRLNVYKFTPYDGDRYARYPENLCVWFTDSTTGHETYEVGRYVDVGNDLHDPGHLYTIDLNKAYNPYCAYSAMYSCAIPRREDHLPIRLQVGEMKYHD
ncbi:MAG TPA: DUF1684 domain-containing protein [Bacteroidota bacterium]|nr:DUF1684 domain-containing protein [Bacteroidota bacterium]